MPEMKLGELLVTNRIITQEQFDKALEVQKKSPDLLIGQILCQLGYLCKHDLDITLDYYKKRLRLGDILVHDKVIDQRMLEHALTVSRKEKIPLGKVLINLRYIHEEQLARAVAKQHDLPFLSLQKRIFSPEHGRYLNANYAMKHKLVVIEAHANTLTMAMASPLNPIALRELENLTERKITPVVARESDITHALEHIYGVRRTVETGSDEMRLDLGDDLSDAESRSRYVLEHNVEYSLKKILTSGVKARASDIHMESTESGMQIRYRIDGVLQHLNLGGEEQKIAGHGASLVSKIKILCEMDITERRRPQDGSFRVKISSEGEGRNIDFRVSTLPTRYGEDVVIRILDKMGPMTLETVGFAPEHVKTLEQLLDKPTGIFIASGPTGSGKTSTLYAILSRLNRPGVKILTVEDPIEYSVEGIRQAEVNAAIGNTFASFLRTFLRQDPDHIMVGEIRDLDTASIAIRASLTGHTVLSTLHTNDATSVVTRLIDMGVEPALVSSTLRCVIAQRLVRINCGRCRQRYQPTPEAQKIAAILNQPFDFVHGKGCPACNFSGYAGRKPIVEMWAPTRNEAIIINRNLNNSELRDLVFRKEGRQTMFANGLEQVRKGETTIEELLRVVPFEQIEELLRH